jgi:hypothetical protein
MRHIEFFRFLIPTLLCAGIMTTASAQFSGGGAGTEQNPYKIVTAEDLNKVRNYLDKYFRMMNDIDLTAFLAGNTEGWEPIGSNYDNSFTGHFNGGGYEVKGLRINRTASGTLYVGLFGYNDGTIDNLGIGGGTVSGSGSGSSSSGGLIGYNTGTITNCYATGDVSGSSSSGGLTGVNSGTIINCYATGNVSSSSSFSSSSSYFSGGLTGLNSGTITNCYATGNVFSSYSSYSYSGGLIGYNGGAITNCYATGNVSSYSYSGGLIGYNNSSGTLTNCYVTGIPTIIGSTHIGAVIGYNLAGANAISRCYYNKDVVGNALVSVGNGTGNANALGLTTTEMKRKNSFVGWDFNTVWNIEEGVTYPYLRSLLSTDAMLKSLTVSSGTLSPSFNANTTSYTVNVANNVTNITVTGTANHSSATVTGNVTNKTLSTGNNTVTITVTAEDGTTKKTYTVTVVRAKSSDATLKSLTVSSGTLSPSFNTNTTSYTVNVANNVTNITVTGTVNHSVATITGNVTNKTLSTGNNTVTITVTAEDGTTTKTYTVTVVRAKSSDATLKSLTVSSGTLSPSFSANTISYTVNVANNVTSITVTGTANHSAATITGNVTNKTLSTGNNTVTITVTAEDGTTTKTYTITVVRAKSSDATLKILMVSSGSLSPSFNANTTSYSVRVLYNITGITITGTANHSAATVSGNVTNKTLSTGNNTVTIKVTAEDGTTTKTYTVTVSRDDHVLVTEANLFGIMINGKSLSPDNLNYIADCGENILDDLQASPYASVTVNGVPYVAGRQIELTGNITTVNIRVEAETGGATNNYTLKITNPITDNRLYYQRWDVSLAVSHNPETNGGYNITDVRWYGRDGTPAGNGFYLWIPAGASENYYAEVNVDGEWHRACRSNESRSIEKIAAYPNPVSSGESLTLRLPESFVGGTMQLYDIRGSLIKSGLPLPATVNSVDVSGLSSGIYLLHLTGSNGNRDVVKIIVN